MSRSGAVAMFAAALVLFGGTAYLLMTAKPDEGKGGTLVVYCAVGVRPPVQAAAKAYTEESGVEVRLQYGASQTLLANAEVGGEGDLYLPADDAYIAMGREKGLVEESVPLAVMTAALAVRKGNPKGVKGVEDLLRDGVRVVQAQPDAAAVGKLVREALLKQGSWERLKARTEVFKPTVNDVANDLKLGTADAGFVWDVTLALYPELEAVPVPALAEAKAAITAGVLRSSKRPAAALRFARYLAAPEKGGREFAKGGYVAAGGDPWTETPELHMFAGAMLRPAVERTIEDFERREGAKVTRVYNGCGILVAQMKAGERPDLYFSCDQQFMEQVKGYFEKPVDVSVNQLVILVPKGNPHGIRKLKDMAKPGLRLGVGHEQQCALGALTKETLIQDGTYPSVMKNVVVQVPTGDMLVNQLRVGALDAAVTYVSNAASAADLLEAHPVEVPCAMAVQPVAVGRETKRPQLALRLMESFTTARSKERFLGEGFRWKASP